MRVGQSLILASMLYGGIGLLGLAFIVGPSRRLSHFCRNTVSETADVVVTCGDYERRLWLALAFAGFGIGLLAFRRTLVKRRNRN